MGNQGQASGPGCRSSKIASPSIGAGGACRQDGHVASSRSSSRPRSNRPSSPGAAGPPPFGPPPEAPKMPAGRLSSHNSLSSHLPQRKSRHCWRSKASTRRLCRHPYAPYAMESEKNLGVTSPCLNRVSGPRWTLKPAVFCTEGKPSSSWELLVARIANRHPSRK